MENLGLAEDVVGDAGERHAVGWSGDNLEGDGDGDVLTGACGARAGWGSAEELGVDACGWVSGCGGGQRGRCLPDAMGSMSRMS